jgi:hypothetical protein
MEYGSVRNKEITAFTTWMDLEYIMFSEITQAQKDKYYMVSLLCWLLKKIKLIETGESREMLVKVHKFQLNRTNECKSSIVNHGDYSS